MQKYHATLALSLLLAGCAVGPDYQKPGSLLPGSWLSSSAQTQEAEDKAAIEQNWWKHFHDPILDQFIEKATAGNDDLKIAESRIAQARAAHDSAVAALLPTVNATASAERQANRIAFPGPIDLSAPFNLFQTGFDASWELDLFGGKKRAAEAEAASFSAAEATRDDVRISLLAEVARTYIDIRQYQAQLALAQNTIDANRHTAGIAQERYASGSAPKLEVTQAKAQVREAEAELPYYQNLLAQSEYSMDVLLGELPGLTKELVTERAPLPAADKKLVLAAPARVIAQRPDIRTAERRLAAATAQQGVAVAQFFPDISLSGFVGLLNTSSGDLLQAGSKSWDVGGNVLWPILNFGKLSANLDAADARQQEALATYRKTLIAALSDVEKSVTAYTKQTEYRDALGKEVTDNRHALDIAQQRYKQGASSFLEVLDAERTLYASESKLAQADAKTLQDMVAAYKSLGGGWEDTADSKAACE